MTDTTIADTTQEVTDATQEAVKQVNQLTQYVQDSIPGLITFGLKGAGGTGGILYRPAGDPVDPEDRQTFL